ncbi:MAG TPA: glyoxalase [Idiomarina sp.]|uniref:VOC family protein n=1 Tax=Idiomarina TaxID=135575 RepID=UPI000C508E27|nr:MULTISPECIES: VOC family protein [Idiomarina]MAF75453.1 glyoxalase [Idiomarinaceae bacterium]MEC8925079.1 VOC family protein [Pseudomonadota bacterium]MBL73746.1 glyoxalase [Idiomarinaceae bacterium]MEC9319682.1 VOC family protein [Pseudomonadota bacterium]HAE90902.1 glyoxalase [Idiomarina sp.]
MSAVRPFHLALPVKSLDNARKFYGEILGLEQGRSSDDWIDWNFFGHQFVTHVAPEIAGVKNHSGVDGHNVPVPHFGVVLLREDWDDVARKIAESDIEFVIEPYIRFQGKPGEQGTMFFYDYCGNALEFKTFKSDDDIFAT